MIEFVLVTLLLLTLWFAYRYKEDAALDMTEEKVPDNVLTLRIGKTAVRADIARTAKELMKGLMFKKEGCAILVFPYEARHSIWMAFMRFSLDLIYLDKEKRVVDIKEHVHPLSFNPRTWRLYRPKAAAKYVLEVKSGFVHENHIRIGTKASW